MTDSETDTHKTEAELRIARVQALSNADLAPGGIAMPGTPKADAHAAPVKVASVVPGAPRKRLHEPGGAPTEEACDEEPTKPEPVYKTEIEYTAAARAEGIEGRLVLKLIIAADGSVSDVEVVSSVEPALDAAAVAAVKQWRFKPALANNKPVAVWVAIPLKFNLSGKPFDDEFFERARGG
jgi:protein TonB